MCGIMGVVGNESASEIIFDGLKRLEYRGYDSAGIATISSGDLSCVKAEGKLTNLAKELARSPLSGTIGIGHTRWATHGSPNTTNAHPHLTEKVAVIHNGIIENYLKLREMLVSKNYQFHTETDTEVVPVLITYFLDKGLDYKNAVKESLNMLEGAFALCIIFSGNEDLMVVAKKGSPLAIGVGKGAMYAASDAYALAPLTNKIIYLHDGDWAELSKESYIIYDQNGNKIQRELKISNLGNVDVGKGNYKHFMLKEIYEQPSVLAATLKAYYNPLTCKINLPNINFDLSKISKITIVACGTSYYAGYIAKYWLEKLAKIPTSIDIASEFRYQNSILPENGLTLFISQSGETADTLAALRYAKECNQHIISVINARESSMERESDAVLHTYAGPEIGVASTKAFTTQLVVLACFTIALAEVRKALSAAEIRNYLYKLAEIPSRVVEVLSNNDNLLFLIKNIMKAKDVLYIGRGVSYPLALEGALKLKEISYIHAEGIAAGELKHGTIALIDNKVPVIVIAPTDELFDKTASNVQEVAARGGKVIFLSDAQGIAALKDISAQTIEIPAIDPLFAPILYAIPVQLIAYHTAVAKGTDVDQPRNLAKSVTVE